MSLISGTAACSEFFAENGIREHAYERFVELIGLMLRN